MIAKGAMDPLPEPEGTESGQELLVEACRAIQVRRVWSLLERRQPNLDDLIAWGQTEATRMGLASQIMARPGPPLACPKLDTWD